LVNTSAGTRCGAPDYVSSGCGVGRGATLHMLERGVRLTGTDAWLWDAPFVHSRPLRRRRRDIGYWHLEKLDNLETLPDDGFTVSCFLVKIHAALAGWTRAVAIVDGQ
jgi:hypothetical protein